MSHEYSTFEFDPHAWKRMRERSISRRQVIRTIQNPDRVYSGHSGRLIAEYTTEFGNTLSVVFEEHRSDEETVARIITVIRKGRTR